MLERMLAGVRHWLRSDRASCSPYGSTLAADQGCGLLCSKKGGTLDLHAMLMRYGAHEVEDGGGR